MIIKIKYTTCYGCGNLRSIVCRDEFTDILHRDHIAFDRGNKLVDKHSVEYTANCTCL